MKQALTNNAINWLQQLITIPSISKEETETADLLVRIFQTENIVANRYKNNIWVKTKAIPNKPVILLNSHHDTVKPVSGWRRNPYEPTIEKGKLFGLGSNDAGASLVGLMATFLYANSLTDLPFQLVFVASAEEEISGKDGIEAVLPMLGSIDFGIVGEPTMMKMATAEKGLLVIDAIAKGTSGHAAREEGENAIYKALDDIQFLKNYVFEKTSHQLGQVKISVTQIEAGTQHNVVPDYCKFVIDVRTTDAYSNKEIVDFLQQHTLATLTARSFRLNASGIHERHPLVQTAQKMGIETYGSATLSDQALMHFPTVKMGIGDSARSHTADEYITIQEIKDGIDVYFQFMDSLIQHYKNN